MIQDTKKNDELYQWKKNLVKNLSFPFDVKIYEYEKKGLNSGMLNLIDIDYSDDQYGVIVKVTIGQKKYTIPLSGLEAVNKDSSNYKLLYHYHMWFSMR